MTDRMYEAAGRRGDDFWVCVKNYFGESVAAEALPVQAARTVTE